MVFDEPERGPTGGEGLMLYRREDADKREEPPRLYNREPVNGDARAGEQGGERMQALPQGRASFGRAEVGGGHIVLCLTSTFW